MLPSFHFKPVYAGPLWESTGETADIENVKVSQWDLKVQNIPGLPLVFPVQQLSLHI